MSEAATLVFPPIAGLHLQPEFRLSHTPMGQMIGLQYLAFGEAHVGTGLAYDDKLIGNAHSGVLHGGVLTAMIDETAGGAVVTATKAAHSLATVDLRVDYMRPAEPSKAIFCLAHCYRLTRRIAFIRAEVFHQPDRPIAVGTGTFMLGANNTKPNLLVEIADGKSENGAPNNEPSE